MEIKIGADELILWLRKNKKADRYTTIHLGSKISKLIKSSGGRLIVHDEKCFWDTEINSLFINEDKLPKTASQYIIDSSEMRNLYIVLSGW